MNYDLSLLKAANSVGLCSAYYKLCNDHPFISGSGSKKIPFKEILAAAEGIINLSKLRGPGTVFQVGRLPEGVSLNIIIQSGGTVETDIIIQHPQKEYRATFAILSNETLKYAGLSAPNPAYPRPICASAKEMIIVFARLQELTISLAKAALNVG
ncbi:hypothetical protein [Pseudomonas sp. 1928-m]|uniref:hypothetical protein n=1 Tax=Pseudomonas sp. 1928-m TaxID=3033804 RepID=UPI0023DE86A4|nr:hypothetical protein [Pseudomonas sp. 1928-m]MDF3196600.1 hypothetical protein [Pseudomonas sp. 1928-m]